MGGGSGNAKELVAQTQTVNPEAARLMQNRLNLADKTRPNQKPSYWLPRQQITGEEPT